MEIEKYATINYLLNEAGRKDSILKGGNGERLQNMRVEVDETIIKLAKVSEGGRIEVNIGFNNTMENKYEFENMQTDNKLDYRYDNVECCTRKRVGIIEFDKVMESKELIEFEVKRIEDEEREREKLERIQEQKNFIRKIKIGKWDEKEKVKIIQSKKFKEHIKAHEQDFISPYYKLLSFIERKGYLNNCKGDFIEKVIKLPFEIGYTHLSEIGEEDFIVYAKRHNRDNYSKFTLNRRKRVTNKCVLVLSKNKNADNEYFIVTMFPGEYAVKELEDRNIKTEDEMEKVVQFWSKHAFAYDVNIINPETIIDQDSYRKIYGQG